MKRSTFILVGMLLTVLAIGMVACSPKSKQAAEDNTMTVLVNSSTNSVSVQRIGTLERGSDVGIYELKYEGSTYLIVGRYSAVAIIKHKPEAKQLVNMDSVVANSPWIDEYSMLGYTQAKPSKESLESLTNPEVRPVPLGSEEAFIDYHTKPSSVSLQYQSLLF